MESLGEFLRQGREEAGLSLEDLAGRTRIRIENLDSLEKEDLESLPSDPYVRGFVRLVCRELGLEPTDGLLRYDTLRRASGQPDEIVWGEERVERSAGALERALRDPDRVVRAFGKAAKWGGALLGAAVVVGLVAFAVRTMDSGARQGPDGVGVRPPEPTAPPVAGTRGEGEGPGGARPETPPAPAVAAPRTSREEALPARTAEEPPASPAPPALRARARSVATGERITLRVEALRPVSVTVQLDGVGVPRTKVLDAGETASWRGDSLFLVSVPDGGALRIFLQGEDLGLAGADGDPVEGLRVLRRDGVDPEIAPAP